MSLREYFESTEGAGILATADSRGEVDLAIYGRPHVIDQTTIAFIMRDRRSHANLQSNPKAAYMFIADGQGYQGKRLYLTRTREETDPQVIDSVRRSNRCRGTSADEKSYLVYFSVDAERPLVGG